MTDDSSSDMGKVVAFVRGIPGVPHDDQVKAICLFVFAGAGGRSARRTEKLAARYMEPMGLAVPSFQTIATWAHAEGWHKRADDVWRHNHQRIVVDTQAAIVSAMASSAQNMADIAAGVDPDPLEERVVKMQAFKMVMQAARDLPGLTRVTPPDEVGDAVELSREALEAKAKQALIRRGRTG